MLRLANFTCLTCIRYENQVVKLKIQTHTITQVKDFNFTNLLKFKQAHIQNKLNSENPEKKTLNKNFKGKTNSSQIKASRKQKPKNIKLNRKYLSKFVPLLLIDLS